MIEYNLILHKNKEPWYRIVLAFDQQETHRPNTNWIPPFLTNSIIPTCGGFSLFFLPLPSPESDSTLDPAVGAFPFSPIWCILMSSTLDRCNDVKLSFRHAVVSERSLGYNPCTTAQGPKRKPSCYHVTHPVIAIFLSSIEPSVFINVVVDVFSADFVTFRHCAWK